MKSFALILLINLSLLVTNSSAQSFEIDGSSTVYPLTNAVLSMFKRSNSISTIKLSVSGTGGGFKRFVKGETSINNSSRTPKTSELAAMKSNGIDMYELPLALDGIALVVNKQNYFVNELTKEELQKIWVKGSTIKTWRDLRTEWPSQEINLFGPGLDSGTREFFAEYLFDNTSLLRTDYEMSEDDDELEKDVEKFAGSLSFFGVAYVSRNNDQVKVIGLKELDVVYEPTYSAIQRNFYPLSRTLFLHINKNHLAANTDMARFLSVYIKSIITLSKAAGYIPLDARIYKKHLDSLAEIPKARMGK